MLLEDIWSGRRRGRSILWVMSLLCRAVVFLRHTAYRFRLISSKQVPAVVVSVGNIICGGTGKTPLVHFLAEELSKNYAVAILSRGYRSKASKRREPTLVHPLMRAEEIGDEPLWLAHKLPQVQIWVCASRYRAAQKALENKVDILLLDDGFQHRKLHRDFDIVVVAGEAPFSNGYFLPRGYLRDLPSRLSEATLLAVMGSPLPDFKEVPQVLFERTTPIDLKGKKVALFCAIAHPERFEKQVREAGAHISAVRFKHDHGFFSGEELEKLAQESGAELLVCTEKDFVKIPSKKMSVPLISLPLELKIQDGKDRWEQLIQQIQSQVGHVRRISSHAS